ncbi:hypothetical protein FR943_14240 [Mycobacterium sp. TNTM28]|uniref:Lipoprotein LppE n=1 Tax=[Mycobacterium] fortunisiensis TaxID=2600579 RepID=A0ABS6KN01_9MYCO|nr:hypothetical protein [[Mycobacterium] fortunisiensis]
MTVFAVSGCAAATGVPADTNTARITLEGQDTLSYPILCTQRSWLWTLETLPDTPGFTAIVSTGASISPEIVRISDVHGFTGSAAGDRMAGTEASIHGTTFTVSGTAHGSFADRPTGKTEVKYRLEAHC